MAKIIHILFRSWYTLDKLEDRIYHIVLDVAVFISLSTVVAGLILRSPASSVISSALVLLYVIILQYVTMRHAQYANTCRLLLVLGLNLLLFPSSFLASGGINSGFVLFYLLGLAMCAILLRGNLGGIPKERTETLTRDGHYIAMFDVDNFKKLNDTYGHSFGDRVLIDVSGVLHDIARPECGEITSRYGGEEFVAVLTAESLDAAFARVDEARHRIMTLRWEDHPEVHVSISGGLLSCEDHPDLTQAMHDVDTLLYKAKAAGKDQICVSGT